MYISLITYSRLPNQGLSGNIPVEIGYLTNLNYIGIWDNPLEGVIPDSICSNIALENFYIDGYVHVHL